MNEPTTKYRSKKKINIPLPGLLKKYLETIKRPTYLYEAEVIRWVDGDTVELVVDVGFYMDFGREDNPITFRLYGMDTPEEGKENYDVATEFAQAMAPVGSTVIVKSVKNEKGELSDDFGRYIGIIYVEGQKKSVNESLVDAGLAVVRYF